MPCAFSLWQSPQTASNQKQTPKPRPRYPQTPLLLCIGGFRHNFYSKEGQLAPKWDLNHKGLPLTEVLFGTRELMAKHPAKNLYCTTALYCLDRHREKPKTPSAPRKLAVPKPAHNRQCRQHSINKKSCSRLSRSLNVQTASEPQTKKSNLKKPEPYPSCLQSAQFVEKTPKKSEQNQTKTTNPKSPIILYLRLTLEKRCDLNGVLLYSTASLNT